MRNKSIHISNQAMNDFPYYGTTLENTENFQVIVHLTDLELAKTHAMLNILGKSISFPFPDCGFLRTLELTRKHKQSQSMIQVKLHAMEILKEK